MHNLDTNRNWIGCLSNEVQDSIDQISIYKNLCSGEVLHDVKAKGDYLYQVVSGRVEARIPYENGSSILLDILVEGDCFGEIQFVREDDFFVSYVTGAKTVLRQIPRREFELLQNQFPEIKDQWLAQFAQRLGAGITMYSNISMQRLPARLATRLYFEMRKRQRQEANTKSLELNITQENFADMLGSSRDSISKIFKTWAKAGVIQLGYGRVTIIDADKLLQLSSVPIAP